MSWVPKTRAILNSPHYRFHHSSPTPAPHHQSAPHPNRSPNLSITGERFVTLPNKATLTAIATDDGHQHSCLTESRRVNLPLEQSLRSRFRYGSPLTTKTTTPSAPQAPYQITATVSDGDLFASYTIGIIAAPCLAESAGPQSYVYDYLSCHHHTCQYPSRANALFYCKQDLPHERHSHHPYLGIYQCISCTASSGWSGSKTASGSTTLTPVITTTYTLSCKGGGGDSGGQVRTGG